MTDQSVDCSQIQDLLPLYALEALPADECTSVVLHVTECARCAAELADYFAVTETLAENVPIVEAPPELEKRIRAAMALQAETMPRSSRWPGLGLWRWVPGAAIVTLAVLVLLLGGLALRLNRELAQTRTEMVRLTEALVAQDTPPIRIVGEPDQAPAARGRFIYTEHSREGVLVVQGLPAPPDDRVYQLWLVRKDGGRDSGGLFRPDARGQAWLMVQAPRPWSEYQAMGVTVEPAGGSPGPTGPRALRSDL